MYRLTTIQLIKTHKTCIVSPRFNSSKHTRSVSSHHDSTHRNTQDMYCLTTIQLIKTHKTCIVSPRFNSSKHTRSVSSHHDSTHRNTQEVYRLATIQQQQKSKCGLSANMFLFQPTYSTIILPPLCRPLLGARSIHKVLLQILT